jgi:hypothetical protein
MMVATDRAVVKRLSSGAESSRGFVDLGRQPTNGRVPQFLNAPPLDCFDEFFRRAERS